MLYNIQQFQFRLDIACSLNTTTEFNPFQRNITFHIETSHLTCTANQMAGLYMKCNTRLKWVNPFTKYLIVITWQCLQSIGGTANWRKIFFVIFGQMLHFVTFRNNFYRLETLINLPTASLS